MQTQSSTSVPLPLTWFNINDYNASALTKLYVHVMQITAWLLILEAGMLDAFKFQQPFLCCQPVRCKPATGPPTTSTCYMHKLLWVDLDDRSNTQNRYDLVRAKSGFKNDLFPLFLISFRSIDSHDKEIKQDLRLYMLLVR